MPGYGVPYTQQQQDMIARSQTAQLGTSMVTGLFGGVSDAIYGLTDEGRQLELERQRWN